MTDKPVGDELPCGPFVRRTDVTMHELDGEALVYDPLSADTHRLNCTAYFIWRQCDGDRSAREIAERLTRTYDVSTEAAREHVEHTLGEFCERNLVTEPDKS